MNDDLSDRFEIAVDPDAEPVDFDDVLAGFLLSYVRSEDGSADHSQKPAKNSPAKATEPKSQSSTGMDTSSQDRQCRENGDR